MHYGIAVMDTPQKHIAMLNGRNTLLSRQMELVRAENALLIKELDNRFAHDVALLVRETDYNQMVIDTCRDATRAVATLERVDNKLRVGLCNNEELAAAKAVLEAQGLELTAAKAALGAQARELAAAKATAKSQAKELAAAKAAAKAQSAELAAAKAQAVELAASKAQSAELEAAKAAFEAQALELAAAKASLQRATQQVTDLKAEAKKTKQSQGKAKQEADVLDDPKMLRKDLATAKSLIEDLSRGLAAAKKDKRAAEEAVSMANTLHRQELEHLDKQMRETVDAKVKSTLPFQQRKAEHMALAETHTMALGSLKRMKEQFTEKLADMQRRLEAAEQAESEIALDVEALFQSEFNPDKVVTGMHEQLVQAREKVLELEGQKEALQTTNQAMRSLLQDARAMDVNAAQSARAMEALHMLQSELDTEEEIAVHVEVTHGIGALYRFIEKSDPVKARRELWKLVIKTAITRHGKVGDDDEIQILLRMVADPVFETEQLRAQRSKEIGQALGICDGPPDSVATVRVTGANSSNKDALVAAVFEGAI